MTATHKKSDLLFAHIAINVVPGLSGVERQVAGAILEHYNRKTGRCDPSVDRIAVLLQVSSRMVRKATQKLCGGEHRLFKKISPWRIRRSITIRAPVDEVSRDSRKLDSLSEHDDMRARDAERTGVSTRNGYS